MESKNSRPNKLEHNIQKFYEDIINQKKSSFGREEIDGHKLNIVKQLISYTKIKPSENFIQDKYNECIDKSDIKGLEGLIKITGIQPKPSKKIIQKEYKWNLSITSKNFERLFKLTSIKPILPQRLIQEKYERYLENNELNELKKVIKITGVKPTEKSVQRVYESNIRTGWIWKFYEIYNFAGIKPTVSEDIVQKGYKSAVFYFDRFDKLKESIDILEIKPKFSVNSIQEKYGEYIKKGHLDNLDNLMKITNIPLDNFNRGEIHGKYHQYLDENRLDNIRKLHSLTGIKPELIEREVHSKYDLYAIDNKFENIPRLKKISGIEPFFSKKSLQEKYDKYLKEKLRKQFTGNPVYIEQITENKKDI